MTRTVTSSVDLRGLTPLARDVVLAALDRGWTATMSNKNHCIMRWPGGGTTAVSRNLQGNRRLRNIEASIQRVERMNPITTEALDQEQAVQSTTTTTTTTAAPEAAWTPWFRVDGTVAPAVETRLSSSTGLPEYRCAVCHEAHQTPAGTSRHATRIHGRAAVDALNIPGGVQAKPRAPFSAVATAAGADTGSEVKHSAGLSSPSDFAPTQVKEAPERATTPTTVGLKALLDLATGELAAELMRERERNKRLVSELLAIRDLIDELVAE